MDAQDTLTKELLQHDRANRRFRYVRLAVIAGLAAAYLVAGASFFNKGYGGRHATSSEPHVAVVSLKGAIGDGESIAFDAVRERLHSAFADKEAKAVVLQINSPGGAPVQASLIHDEIKALKKQYPQRKVIAVAEDYVASGGYFIAMAADKLVVNRSTLTGSVGVISRSFGFAGLMEKLGVERRAFTAGSAKNSMDPFLPLKEQDLEKHRELLEAIHKHFTDEVLAARKEKLKAPADELFTGAVWTGEKAVALGMADELGSLSTVMADVGATKVVVYERSPNLLQMLAQGIGTSAADRLIGASLTQSEAPSMR